MAAPERRKMIGLFSYWDKKSILYRIKETILPVLFPRRCPFCQRTLPYSTYICKTCQEKLPFIHHPICMRCGKPLNHTRQEYCYDCRIFPKSFDQGLALFLYNSMTRSATTAFKYHNQRFLADFFVRSILARHGKEIKSWNLQAIIPIPIHKNKRKKRGYNQAELLAKQLAYYLNLPCYNDLIIRTVDTLPQKQFSPQARLNNLNHAFAYNAKYQSEHKLSSDLKKNRVLLIDDIYTTGATLEACTKILKNQGFEKVYVYALCIGVSRDEII